jgi:hypothetical protein
MALKILRKFKRSTKFICRKCGYPATATDGSNCQESGKCSPCMTGARRRKITWKKPKVKGKPKIPVVQKRIKIEKEN